MQRVGMVLRLKPGCAEAYKTWHRQVWPEVLEMISACNIRNYSIYLKDHLLFSYFEYHGADLAADQARMAAHAKTLEWWALMEPLLDPLPGTKPGELWAGMDEVFHLN